MAIPDHAQTNFKTLLRAAADGNLALMECTDAATGEPRYVIAAVGRDSRDIVMTPFGHLANGNPYDAYTPHLVGADPGTPSNSTQSRAVR